jgi:hypothetical protein
MVTGTKPGAGVPSVWLITINFFRMLADLWVLVFSFALNLERLDRVCAQDLESFACVERSAATAIARLWRVPGLRLRFRVHRIFGFRTPTKTSLRLLLPRFNDQLPPGELGKDLWELSNMLVRYQEAESWVVWGEGRPERVAALRRSEEEGRRRAHEAELKYKERLTSIEEQCRARGLPYDFTDNAVQRYAHGLCESAEPVFAAMRKVQKQQAVAKFVAWRDLAVTASEEQRREELARLARKFDVVLPADVPDRPKSPAQLLAVLWIRQTHGAWRAAKIQDKLVQQVGQVLIRSALPIVSASSDLEAALWLRTARKLWRR